MAKKETRIVIKLVSSASKYTYWTQKSKRNDPARIEMMKYDPTVRKHVMFKEAK